ncbi:UbiA prenyltransferase [Colletotrichum sojae]|uniref:UbiA prenyltransferase n=1 Tax=Colletotrichum sojae TaxID=2175907 RepID=A0A8H6MVW2_9PEZI|nr:UbiA prenyltransferase [Colletotrichum sojae]
MEESLKTQEREPPAAHPLPLSYHLKTIFLFTKSDFKTVVLPQTLFTVSSLLTSGFRTIDTYPTITFTAAASQLAHAMFWVWACILLESIANQRLPGSVVEDAANKPWRPLPAGRLTQDQARDAAMRVVPGVLALGAASGAFRETAALLCMIWMYNDLGAANASIWWRNAVNAGGLMLFSAGATAVATGPLDYSFKGMLPSDAVQWILVTGALIITTIHGQDLPDVIGDAARGRRTIPLVYGDKVARWSLAAGVAAWSVAVPAFWGMGLVGYVPTVVVGAAMVFGTLWRRTLEDDEVVWKLWCLWVGIVYLLPGFKVLGLGAC